MIGHGSNNISTHPCDTKVHKMNGFLKRIHFSVSNAYTHSHIQNDVQIKKCVYLVAGLYKKIFSPTPFFPFFPILVQMIISMENKHIISHYSSNMSSSIIFHQSFPFHHCFFHFFVIPLPKLPFRLRSPSRCIKYAYLKTIYSISRLI
jgi:hypothetical protein